MPEHPTNQLQGSDFLSTMMKLDPLFMDQLKNTQAMVYSDGALPRKTKLLIAMAFDAAHGAQQFSFSTCTQLGCRNAPPTPLVENDHQDDH